MNLCSKGSLYRSIGQRLVYIHFVEAVSNRFKGNAFPRSILFIRQCTIIPSIHKELGKLFYASPPWPNPPKHSISSISLKQCSQDRMWYRPSHRPSHRSLPRFTAGLNEIALGVLSASGKKRCESNGEGIEKGFVLRLTWCHTSHEIKIHLKLT